MLAKFLQLCDVISRSRLRDAGCRALSGGRTVLGSRAHFAGGGYLSHTELVRTSHPTIFISFFHLFPTGTFTEEYPLHKLHSVELSDGWSQTQSEKPKRPLSTDYSRC